jgi:hypothetical protein
MKLGRNILVAAVILGSGVVSAAANTITPSFLGTTAVVGGFRWDYQIVLAEGRLDADANLTSEEFFTLYDIRGYLPGSATAPVGWSATSSALGKTTTQVPLTGDTTEPNVTFEYISTTPITCFTPGCVIATFSFRSIFDGRVRGSWTSEDLTTDDPAVSNGGSRGRIAVPTPDGGSTAALLGSVLFAFGMLRRRFGKS